MPDVCPRSSRRNEALLTAAVSASRKYGWRTVTRDQIAREAGMSAGTVNHGYGTVAALRDEVMRHAVAHEMLDLIAQGLGAQCPIAQAAPHALKARALTSLVS